MSNESEMNRLRHKILTMLTFEERMHIQPLLDICLMFATEESRPQGKWIVDKEHSITMTFYKCTNCNHFGGNNTFRYCPNCGAKMGADNEDSN